MFYFRNADAPLSVGDNLRDLRAFADTLYWTTVVAGSWTADVPETELKILLGHHLYDDALGVESLRVRIAELERAYPPDGVEPRGRLRSRLLDQVAAATRVVGSPARMYGLYQGVKRSLLSAIGEHVDRAHPIWDAPTVRALREIASALESQLAAVDAVVEPVRELHGWTESASATEARWKAALAEDGSTIALALPQQVARDERFRVVDSVPLPSIADQRTTAETLHFCLMCIEVIVVEVCGRTIADFHAEMPFEFVVDMSRQCWDEARHAMACYDRMQELGAHVGQYPVATQVWDSSIGLSLAERLSSIQRQGEALGTDGALLNGELSEACGDRLTRQMFDYVLVDEIGHVRLGNRWFRHLTASEADARAADQVAEQARLRFGMMRVPPKLPFHRWTRERAGFTRDEVDELEQRRAGTAGQDP